MKKIISISAAVLGLGCLTAFAGLGDPGTVFQTAGLASNVLTNNAYVTNYITPNGRYITFQLSAYAVGASTSNLTVNVYKTIDGTWYDSMATYNTALNGTTQVGVVTNLEVDSIPKLMVVVSATTTLTAAQVTNATLKAYSTAGK